MLFAESAVLQSDSSGADHGRGGLSHRITVATPGQTSSHAVRRSLIADTSPGSPWELLREPLPALRVLGKTENERGDRSLISLRLLAGLAALDIGTMRSLEAGAGIEPSAASVVARVRTEFAVQVFGTFPEGPAKKLMPAVAIRAEHILEPPQVLQVRLEILRAVDRNTDTTLRTKTLLVKALVQIKGIPHVETRREPVLLHAAGDRRVGRDPDDQT